MDLEDITDAQIETEYISQLSSGDTNLAIGKKSVFYLESHGNGQYDRIGGSQGEYLETEGGFKKPSTKGYNELFQHIQDENEGQLHNDEEISTENEDLLVENETEHNSVSNETTGAIIETTITPTPQEQTQEQTQEQEEESLPDESNDDIVSYEELVGGF